MFVSNLYKKRSDLALRMIFCLSAILAFHPPVCAQAPSAKGNVDGAQRTSEAKHSRLSPHLISFGKADIGVQQTGSEFGFQIPDGNYPAASAQDPVDLESIQGIESFPYRGEEQEPEIDPQENDISPNGREIVRQRYPDGKVQIEREVDQDEEGNYYNHGFWRVKSRDGTIVAQGEFERGQMHGVWERKHTKDSSPLFATQPFNLFQGPFTSTAIFENGKLEGVWTLNDQYNRKIFEIPYRSGKRNGTAIWWYPSMTKMREVVFRNGLIDGQLREWDQQNKLTREEEFVSGKKIIRNVSFYRPKQKESESYYLDAKLELDGDDDWWDARPAPMLPIGEKVQHGPLNAWFDNGLPKMKGQYETGLRVGQFSWWHANGNKRLDGDYVRGKKIGKWTWWHENGIKAIEGTYQDDEAVGIWRSWQPDGQLKEERNLSNEQDPSKGSQGNPAALPEGNVQPAPPRSIEPEDDNQIPLMIEDEGLEGIEPIETDDRGPNAGDFNLTTGQLYSGN